MRSRFRPLVLVVGFLLTGALPTAGQLPEDELRSRVESARTSTSLTTLLQGASAARMLGDFDAAAEILNRASDARAQAEASWVNEKIFLALASGEGVNGMQRAFRDARAQVRLTPVQIAAITNTFPALLVGGEFDEMIMSLSADHPDPGYRCACQAQKAWVHKVAGRQHESRVVWGELVTAWDRNPLSFEDPDAQANWQGQYARNLARAGRTADARRELEKAMSMPVTDEGRPMVQRRWAQTYAELGQVDEAVGLLEPLLAGSTLVTVHSLSTRYAWEQVRNNLVFQEMLSRHR